MAEEDEKQPGCCLFAWKRLVSKLSPQRQTTTEFPLAVKGGALTEQLLPPDDDDRMLGSSMMTTDKRAPRSLKSSRLPRPVVTHT